MSKRPPPRTSFRTLPTPPDNPVQLAELAHLEQTRRDSSARLVFWLLLLAFGATLGLSGALYLITRSGHIGGAELADRFEQFRAYADFVNAILSVLLMVSGPVVVLETLLTGSDGIAREHRSGTWGALVLTPLSAWQIVTGKWRAVQAYIYRHYGRLLVLRALAYMWIAMGAGQAVTAGEEPDIFALSGGIVLVVTFAALNQALAGAASLLASFQRGPLASFGGAAAIYFLLMLAVAMTNVVLMQPLLSGIFGTDWTTPMHLFIIAPFDGGVLAATLTQSPGTHGGVLAAFALLNAALLGGMAYALLRLTRWLAVRDGAAA